MEKMILACDLGTGGNKASLYDSEGNLIESTFVPYETFYPEIGLHEQRPMDWWDSVLTSIGRLLKKRRGEAANIGCISFSGHSLGAVPLERDGALLRERTPIWSDRRPKSQTKEFFEKVDQREWYMKTGNGFPPDCYSVFKIMWYRDNEPDLFKKTHRIVGTKDFINFMLTGNIVTDYSYASGSGVYDLRGWDYAPQFIEASGLSRDLFPKIVPSTAIVGELKKDVAEQLGLPRGVKVVCGGVDNSCMALGARNSKDGRVYTSLGTSSWIAVSSNNPVLNAEKRPYVFTHVMPGMFTSAVSIFSACSSLEWVKDTLFGDLKEAADEKGRDIYEIINELAAESPIGAHKLLFNPSLAGGSSQEGSPHLRGAFSGLDLGHTRGDVLRSAMEGIAMNLGLVLELLRKFTKLENEMLMVGGGSKSKLWRQIFADVYDMPVLKTNIGQEAGALGAAAVGAVGTGIWPDFSRIDDIHKIQDITKPIRENVEKYNKIRLPFDKLRETQTLISDMLHDLDL